MLLFVQLSYIINTFTPILKYFFSCFSKKNTNFIWAPQKHMKEVRTLAAGMQLPHSKVQARASLAR